MEDTKRKLKEMADGVKSIVTAVEEFEPLSCPNALVPTLIRKTSNSIKRFMFIKF